jgi:pimeloyl-ACP methyl ester carboxylesterase
MHILLLPGMDGSGDLFGPLVEALPRAFKTTIARYPHDRALGYAELQAQVDAAAPKSTPYLVVAESFSGPLAIRHAAKRPPCLRGLVLCASFAKNPLPRSLHWFRAFTRRPLLEAHPPRAVLRGLLVNRDTDASVLAATMAVVRRTAPHVLAHRLREIFTVDAQESLAAIDVPVLYLAGAQDRLVGGRGLAQLALRLPRLSSVVLDAPHLVLQTRPLEAAREIARFAKAPAARRS